MISDAGMCPTASTAAEAAIQTLPSQPAVEKNMATGRTAIGTGTTHHGRYSDAGWRPVKNTERAHSA